ncbi:hypothetical protein D9M68_983100 [compost metagenome]
MAGARHKREGTINRLGIDVRTIDTNRLIKRLGALSTTRQISNGGRYGADPTWSQVWIDTEMAEQQLDDWLYRVKHDCEYAGVFERRPGQEVAA